MKCIDYSQSFITTIGKESDGIDGNSPRFIVESRCRIIYEKDNKKSDYYQCASCKSERTNVKKKLFSDPNYDFIPVFSEDWILMFRRHAACTQKEMEKYMSANRSENQWGQHDIILSEADPLTVLDSNEKICQATQQCLPIIAQTELWNERTGLRAIIEYPVKTINVNPRSKWFQIDTGIVLWVDLEDSSEYYKKVEFSRIRLSYVAFNCSNFAEFIIEQPTRINPNEYNEISVWHYSGIKQTESKNTLFCIGRL